MGLIDSIFGGGIDKIFGGVTGIIDELTTTDEEKAAARLKIRELVHAENKQMELTFRRELEAKERILIAELQQSDNYTKRARPTIVYAGLAIPLFSVIANAIGLDFNIRAAVPDEFWLAWGAVTGTYAVGRTMEKRGRSNGFSRAVTGSRLLD